MGDSLIIYFFNFGKYKQLRLQLNYPDVKLTAQLCAAPYTLLVPSGEQAPPFLWVLCVCVCRGKQRHDVLGEQCSQQPRRQHQRQQALPCQHRQPLLARRQQVNDLREILEAGGVSSGVTSDLASLLE